MRNGRFSGLIETVTMASKIMDRLDASLTSAMQTKY